MGSALTRISISNFKKDQRGLHFPFHFAVLLSLLYITIGCCLILHNSLTQCTYFNTAPRLPLASVCSLKKRTPGRMISICAIVVLSCPSACFLTGPETAYFSSSRAYSTPREAAYPMISWQLFFLSLECQSPWGSVSSLQETVPYLAWNVSVSAAKVL